MTVPIDVPEGTILTVTDNRGMNAPIGSVAVVDNTASVYELSEKEQDMYICVRWLYGHDQGSSIGQNDGHYFPTSFDVLQEASAIYQTENFNFTGSVLKSDIIRFLNTLPDGSVIYADWKPENPFTRTFSGEWVSNDRVATAESLAGYEDDFFIIAYVPGEAVSYA